MAQSDLSRTDVEGLSGVGPPLPIAPRAARLIRTVERFE